MTNEHEELLPCYTPNVCGLGADYRCTNCLNRPAVAAALAEQAKEIERLKGELAKAQDINGINNRAANDRTQEIDKLQGEVAALRQENERLDAKLTKLARHHENEVAAARIEGLRRAIKIARKIWADISPLKEMVNAEIAALERGKTAGHEPVKET